MVPRVAVLLLVFSLMHQTARCFQYQRPNHRRTISFSSEREISIGENGKDSRPFAEPGKPVIIQSLKLESSPTLEEAMPIRERSTPGSPLPVQEEHERRKGRPVIAKSKDDEELEGVWVDGFFITKEDLGCSGSC